MCIYWYSSEQRSVIPVQNGTTLLVLVLMFNILMSKHDFAAVKIKNKIIILSMFFCLPLLVCHIIRNIGWYHV